MIEIIDTLDPASWTGHDPDLCWCEACRAGADLGDWDEHADHSDMLP